jgi:MYB-CC type transfactor, LHEQLE motif
VNVDLFLTNYRSQEVKEALRAQMEVQRRLHEQVEVSSYASQCMLLMSFRVNGVQLLMSFRVIVLPGSQCMLY